MMNRLAHPWATHSVRAAALVTWVVVALLLAGVLVRGGADTGGRIATVALAAAATVPLAIRSVRLRVPRWTIGASAGASGIVVLALWLAVVTRQDGLAWSMYGGLQVLRGRAPFTDSDVLALWANCGWCEQWDPRYGPFFTWWQPIVGTDLPSWTAQVAGFGILAVSLAAFVTIGRSTGALGRLTLLLAALSPAWLLLLDRANVDALVLGGLVLGAVLVRRRDALRTWWIVAGLLWVGGVLKYFPFAMGLALLPALRVRRGWMVLAGFTLASSAVILASWTALQESSRFNSEKILVLEDFPSYGRLVVLDRLSAFGAGGTVALVANLMIAAVVIVAAIWGWGHASRSSSVRTSGTVLALGGSTAFLSAVLVSGFGFHYKGAFLLACVPLITARVASPKRSAAIASSSVTMVALLALATWVAYSSLLATLSGLLVAGFALGGGLQWAARAIQARASNATTEVNVPQVGTADTWISPR